MVLKDALHNCAHGIIRDEKDIAYGKGIIVGAVAALMKYNNISWAQAAEIVKADMPIAYNEECVPESWRKEF